MNGVARRDKPFRRELFEEAASRRRLQAAIVEKDFWVCWTLQQLFSMPGLGGRLIFKGGTTLSKVFGIIHRFSEDIDLTLDRALIGFADDRNPDQAESRKRRVSWSRKWSPLARTTSKGPSSRACASSLAVS